MAGKRLRDSDRQESTCEIGSAGLTPFARALRLGGVLPRDDDWSGELAEINMRAAMPKKIGSLRVVMISLENSFYYSIALALLLPRTSNDESFTWVFKKLFPKGGKSVIEFCQAALNDFDGTEESIKKYVYVNRRTLKEISFKALFAGLISRLKNKIHKRKGESIIKKIELLLWVKIIIKTPGEWCQQEAPKFFIRVGREKISAINLVKLDGTFGADMPWDEAGGYAVLIEKDFLRSRVSVQPFGSAARGQANQAPQAKEAAKAS